MESVIKAVPVEDLNKRPRVRIDITGTHLRCGKTAVAALVVQALRNAGFDDIMVDCTDGDLKARVRDGVNVTRIVPVPGIDVVDRNGTPDTDGSDPDNGWQA